MSVYVVEEEGKILSIQRKKKTKIQNSKFKIFSWVGWRVLCGVGLGSRFRLGSSAYSIRGT